MDLKCCIHIFGNTYVKTMRKIEVMISEIESGYTEGLGGGKRGGNNVII